MCQNKMNQVLVKVKGSSVKGGQLSQNKGGNVSVRIYGTRCLSYQKELIVYQGKGNQGKGTNYLSE